MDNDTHTQQALDRAMTLIMASMTNVDRRRQGKRARLARLLWSACHPLKRYRWHRACTAPWPELPTD